MELEEICYATTPCIYCTYVYTRVTCKTVKSMYPQGAGHLTTDYVECRHVLLILTGVKDIPVLLLEGASHINKTKTV
jgi:hypothetical protein